MPRLIYIALLLMMPFTLHAQGMDTIEVHFPVNSPVLKLDFWNNEKKINEMVKRLKETHDQRLELWITAGSSPEGPTQRNLWLTEHRGLALLHHLEQKFPEIRQRLRMVDNGQQWARLTEMVEQRYDMPYRDEVLAILKEPERSYVNGELVETRKPKLMALHGGEQWRWMLREMFPQLRATSLVITLPPEKVHIVDTVFVAQAITPTTMDASTGSYATVAQRPVEIVKTDSAIVPKPRRIPGTLMLKTNLAFDLLWMPELGLELNMGRGWSLNVEGCYGWWKTRDLLYPFRSVGGTVELRKYLGAAHKRRSMTGHHVGLYGQLQKWGYDTGYHGDYATDYWGGGGLAYGYSMRIGRRLNLDLLLGVGYVQGDYHHYQRYATQDVWDPTKKKQKWIGPTRLELSLGWRLF